MQTSDLIQFAEHSRLALFVIAVYFIAWTAALVSALKHEELNDVSRFMWVFIIITTPLLGMILYYVMTPIRPRKAKPIWKSWQDR